MKHTKILIALGVVVAIIPYLGFPSSWKNVIFLVLGVAIAAVAFRLYVDTRGTLIAQDSDYRSYQQNDAYTSDIAGAHE